MKNTKTITKIAAKQVARHIEYIKNCTHECTDVHESLLKELDTSIDYFCAHSSIVIDVTPEEETLYNNIAKYLGY